MIDGDLYSMRLIIVFPLSGNAKLHRREGSLRETEPLLPPELGGELLNFLAEVLASLSQIPAEHHDTC